MKEKRENRQSPLPFLWPDKTKRRKWINMKIYFKYSFIFDPRETWAYRDGFMLGSVIPEEM